MDSPRNSQFLHRWILVGAIGILAFVLAGCVVQADAQIDVFDQGDYTMTVDFTIPRMSVEMVGERQIEQQLDQVTTELKQQADVTEASWKRKSIDNQVVVYEISISGSCKAARCDASTFRIDRYPEGGRDAYLFTAQANEIARFGDQVTLTLNAARIVEANVPGPYGDSVTWRRFSEDPRAVIIPKSHFNWPLYGALGLAAILGVTGVVLVRRSSNSPSADTPQDAEEPFIRCSACAAQIPIQARYCPKCGEPVENNPPTQ